MADCSIYGKRTQAAMRPYGIRSPKTMKRQESGRQMPYTKIPKTFKNRCIFSSFPVKTSLSFHLADRAESYDHLCYHA